MNNTFKKIIKGTVAIFAIKIALVTGIFVFQSCQKDNVEYHNQEEAKSSFLTSLSQSSMNINSVNIKSIKHLNSNNIFSRGIQDETETVCLMEFDSQGNSSSVTEEVLNNISSVIELIQINANNNLITPFDPNWIDDNDDSDTDTDNDPNFNPEDCIAIIEIPLQPISEALDPLILEARNYLIATQDFTPEEIDQMIIEEGGDETDLIPLVIAITEYEQNENNSTFNYSTLFINSSYAQDWGDVGNCAMQAIGADILYSLAAEAGNKPAGWKKKAIKKVFGKVASRFLGPIGVAIAVVTFAICLSAAA